MNNREEINKEKAELLKKLKELETKENEIKQQELEEQKKESIKTFEFIKENTNIILPLLKHSRTSCSDEHTDGWDSYRECVKCNKCFIIELLNGEWSPEDYKIDFDINIERID